MSIFFLSLLFLLGGCISATEDCGSHSRCKAYGSGEACNIGDYIQIVVFLNATSDTQENERYYPFCIKVDEVSELYLADSWSWLKDVSSLDSINRGEYPYMTIIAPKGTIRHESLAWPVVGYKSDSYTWPMKFTVVFNLRYGDLMEYSTDTFEFESQCDGDDDCKMFSSKDDGDYECLQGINEDAVTCTVREDGELEIDTHRDVIIKLAWAGSDGKASSLKSESYLPSNLKMLSIYQNVERNVYDEIPIT